MSTSIEPLALFYNAPWLGFEHNGYPVAPLQQYRENRGIEMPRVFNREHLSILQSWLSFGLLEAVTEIKVAEKDLLDSVDGGWDRAESSSLSAKRSEVEKTLKHANKILSYLSESSAFAYPGVKDDNLPAIFCTLGCIGEALANARLCLYLDDDTLPAESFNWDFTVAIQGEVLLTNACKAGWCPSMVNYITAQGNLTAARYSFRLGPARRADDHSQCTVSSCKLTKINNTTYKPQHHVPECTCPYIKPALHGIILAIKSGVNPVIRLPTEQEKSSPLTVLRASEVPYIAVSHVWADGLGSHPETGLPTCQAWKAAAFASAFVDSGAFWLDSLCVPKAPEVRKQALKLMGAAYRDAECVVVLDKTIQTVSKAAPSKEIMSRILTSPWMRRLWTLQEAVLAKKIVFQLADGLFPLLSLDSLITSAAVLQADALTAGLSLEIHRLVKRHRTKALSLGDVARSLKWRSTNRAADEIPAIMSLLPVGFKAIIDASDHEQRMAMLLSDIRHVPRNIPFIDGPKLKLPGFHWAPATFMTVAEGANKGLGGGLQLTTSISEAEVTSKGLVADYLAYEFALSSFHNSERWTLIDIDSKSPYHISTLHETAVYRCNYLLFPGLTLPRGVGICLAVLADALPENGPNGPIICCTFVKRLVVNAQRPDVPLDRKIMSKGASCLARVRIS
ncbi:hypothetical protein BP6252_10784 [Coleophoma cylindrospora]|uniref:Heterokaryon incompatibility domain-containing protein n=1 Tax=Coleophoma cylindrospora TaxID=1849047 RepID=A0A3D8QTI6_9HELO|nr:hypothetical protein BP6252_10784 [Coleophoma cylindrospora]